MSNSVQSDSTVYYEYSATDRLPLLLKTLLGLDVFQVVSTGTVNVNNAWSRKFVQTEFPGTWCFQPSQEIEIDFFAHSNHLDTFPVLTESTTNSNVFATTSKIVPTTTPPTTPTTMSARIPKSDEKPVKTRTSFLDARTSFQDAQTSFQDARTSFQDGQESSRYVVGEVLYGGTAGLSKKLVQLNKDVRIACIKTYGSDDRSHVLASVEVAILVNQNPLAQVVFDLITHSAFPHLAILKDAGRVLFVNDTLVSTKVISILQNQATVLQEKLETQQTIIEEHDHQQRQFEEELSLQRRQFEEQQRQFEEQRRQFEERQRQSEERQRQLQNQIDMLINKSMGKKDA